MRNHVAKLAGPLVACLALAGCGAEPAPRPDPSPAPVETSVPPSPGAAVFEADCKSCHGPGLGGAPRFGSREDWSPRLAKGRDALLRSALEGFVGPEAEMPARGGNDALDDDRVAEALDYMIEAAK